MRYLDANIKADHTTHGNKSQHSHNLLIQILADLIFCRKMLENAEMRETSDSPPERNSPPLSHLTTSLTCCHISLTHRTTPLTDRATSLSGYLLSAYLPYFVNFTHLLPNFSARSDTVPFVVGGVLAGLIVVVRQSFTFCCNLIFGNP